MSKNPNESNSNLNIKDLSFIALFALIFGSMMGSGVFDIPQNIAHKAGLLAILASWCITVVGILCLGGIFVYLVRRRPDIQSGIYGYAKFGFGDYVGFNTAWGYWLSALLGNASYLVYIFATLGDFTFFSYFGKGDTSIALLCESTLIWVIYLLISRGIREAAIFNVMITAVKFVALFTIIVLFVVGFNLEQFKVNLALNMHFGGFLEQIKSTMLVTVWDFLGIEAACIYALRAKNMQDVAKATFFGVLLVLIIDALISILPFGVLNDLVISNLTTPSTAGVLAAISGANIAEIIRIAVIISVSGALLAWMLLATNIAFLASEDKTMPNFLSKISKRNVPIKSLLTSTIVLQIFIIIAHITNSVYLVLIQLATSLILVPYLLSALFAFKLVITDKKIMPFMFIKGFIAVIFGIWLVYAGGLKYLAFSTLLYVVGTVFYVLARKENKQKIFANKFELGIFSLLIIMAVVLSLLWATGYLSLSN